MKGFKLKRGRLCACLCAGASLIAVGPLAVRAEFCPQAAQVLSTTDAASGDAPFVVRCCDLNNDGFPDLVTANDASDTLSVLLNNGDGTYAPKERWPVDSEPKVISEPTDAVCCDVNNDQLIDLISVNHTSDDVSVLLNTGNAQFAAPVKYPVGEAPFGIECLELDGTGGNDLMTNGFTADAVSVLLNNGDGTFAPHVPYATGDAPIAMTLCDVDGDLSPDVVTANMLGKNVTILSNNGNGTLTNIGSFDLCRSPQDCINPFDIVCCDLDGMNGLDVATSNGIDDSVAVLMNDGAGGFTGATFYGGVDGAYAIACCDLDGDGNPDVTTANLSSGSLKPPAPDDLGVFFNDGTGTLGGPTSLPVGADSTADPSSVICCDIENDTDFDLVAAFVDGLSVFENDCSSGSCGDGVTNDGEACDDGFTDACGTCNATCTAPGSGSVCGDGELCPETEECDDNNTESGDGCSSTCLLEFTCDPPTVSAVGPRYISITPAAGNQPVALWVEGSISNPDVSCVSRYVQTVCRGGATPGVACVTDIDCGDGTCANGKLSLVPQYRLPADWETITVSAIEIEPNTEYIVRADCGAVPGEVVSSAVNVTTWMWGDTAMNGNVSFADITKTVDAFRQAGSPSPTISVESTDLSGPGCNPQYVVNFADITANVDAFKGIPYRTIFCPAPCP